MVKKKHMFIGVGVLVGVLFLVAILHTLQGSTNYQKAQNRMANMLCRGIDQNIYELCLKGFSHVLDYIHTHMPDAKITGRRIGYRSENNTWIFGAYVLENNVRYIVAYDPSSGQIGVSRVD